MWNVALHGRGDKWFSDVTLKLLDTTLSENGFLNHSRTMFCYMEGEEERGASVYTISSAGEEMDPF